MELTVRDLCAGLPGLRVDGDQEITVARVTADSRAAGPDVLFVAVKGTAADGHQYLDKAVAKGTRVVAVEGSTAVAEIVETTIRADCTRALPALFARRLNGQPDRHLKTAGVTGTNGKTTVSYLLRQLLAQVCGPCGLIGTIVYDDGKTNRPAPLTTPGGPEFFGLLGDMVANGCRSVAMELSSHALDQGRTAGLELDVAIMTNLGRDHLDYHQNTEAYLEAKAQIMTALRDDGQGRPGTLVLNMADPVLAGLETSDHAVIGFSADPQVSAADLCVTQTQLKMTGTTLEFDWRGDTLRLQSPLVGRFNVENLTAALAAGLGLGLDPHLCADALSGVAQVPGRLERFDLPNGAMAIVDYAHTHDALAAVLSTCDELTDGRLLVVFGCGGDRDQGKRPLMGEVAAQYADLAWITSDNPRSEDPHQICLAIEAGFRQVDTPRANAVTQVVDRRTAIEEALLAAQHGDIVVVAGKGHEDYQLVGDQRLDLDDRQVVLEWIAEQHD